jgi:hypothetical protein
MYFLSSELSHPSVFFSSALFKRSLELVVGASDILFGSLLLADDGQASILTTLISLEPLKPLIKFDILLNSFPILIPAPQHDF